MPNILFIVPFKLEIIPHDNTTKTRILCAKILSIKRETASKIVLAVAITAAFEAVSAATFPFCNAALDSDIKNRQVFLDALNLTENKARTRIPLNKLGQIKARTNIGKLAGCVLDELNVQQDIELLNSLYIRRFDNLTRR